MKYPILLLILGLLLGWLIEWVIDWNFWRKYWRKRWLGDTGERVTSGSKMGAITQTLGKIPGITVSSENQDEIDTNVRAEKLDLMKMLDNDMSSSENRIAWFDEVMERASGEYKRRAILLAFVIGTTMAFIFNVDSIEIATQMWREPTLRQVIVAQANNTASNGGTQISSNDFVDQVNQLGIPVGWTTTPATADKPCGWIPGEAVYLGIRRDNTCQIFSNLPRMDDGWGWLIKFSGLLISGLAAAQGAPFWFDILKKLINLRSSGSTPKSERSNQASSS